MDNLEQQELLVRISERVKVLQENSEKTQEELKTLSKSVTTLETTVNTVSEKVKAMITRYKWPSPKYIVGIVVAGLTAAGVAVPSILSAL